MPRLKKRRRQSNGDKKGFESWAEGGFVCVGVGVGRELLFRRGGNQYRHEKGYTMIEKNSSKSKLKKQCIEIVAQ